MKYYYLDKNYLIQNKVVIAKQTNFPIPDFKLSLGDNIIEYVTLDSQNIPNNWGYSEQNETLFNKDTKPSPCHEYIDGVWKIVDIEKCKSYLITSLKNLRDKSISQPIFYKDKFIQTRGQEDLDNLKDIMFIMEDGQRIKWITLDNSIVLLYKSDFEEILNIYRKRKNQIYYKYIMERNYLDTENSIELLEVHFSYLLKEGD